MILDRQDIVASIYVLGSDFALLEVDRCAHVTPANLPSNTATEHHRTIV